MHNKQLLTPKYWMFHDKTCDDVLIATASKSFDGCNQKARELYVSHFEEYQMIVTILLVCLKLIL